MGGLPCAKEIIDNGAGLTRVLACMSATIQLRSGDQENKPKHPTYDQRDRFLAASEALAQIAMEIDLYLWEGINRQDETENGKSKDEDKYRKALDILAPPGVTLGDSINDPHR